MRREIAEKIESEKNGISNTIREYKTKKSVFKTDFSFAWYNVSIENG